MLEIMANFEAGRKKENDYQINISSGPGVDRREKGLSVNRISIFLFAKEKK